MEEDKVEDLMILSEDLRPVHGFEKVVERNNYINKHNLHAYVYEGGYVKLMDLSKENGILMTLGLLLLTFSLCSVFTQDYETGQKNVVAGNFTGKKKDGTQKNTGFCIHYYNFIWDYLFAAVYYVLPFIWSLWELPNQ